MINMENLVTLHFYIKLILTNNIYTHTGTFGGGINFQLARLGNCPVCN